MRTIASLRRIEDPDKRVMAASELVREASERAEAARARRDLAALHLIEPFARAVAPSNAKRAQAKRDYDAGVIDSTTYYALLEQTKAERKAALREAEVTVFPNDVYTLIGVFRSLFVRMMARFDQDYYLPPLEGDLWQIAEQSAADVRKYTAIDKEARQIRDDTVAGLFDSPDAPTSAHIARLTGLTTARVCQMRQGA